ncbi:MAG: hypothetical protein Ct9H300mP11_18170 [Chloroflexota bacterium]|nr:MAG: hypothetical protein Ct9H300mP11_18170 [Chloroflexota bacterium]
MPPPPRSAASSFGRKIASGKAVSELDFSLLLHEEYASEDGFYDLSFTTSLLQVPTEL